MPLPTMTDEQREAAAEKAMRVRYERRATLSKVKTGTITISELLEQTGDPVVGKMRLRQVLRALPGYGPKRTEELLASLGIDSNRKLQGLGIRQRDALLNALS